MNNNQLILRFIVIKDCVFKLFGQKNNIFVKKPTESILLQIQDNI